jgi:acetyl esterase/lipase
MKVAAPGVDDAWLVVHFHSGGYLMGSANAYREFAGRLSAAVGAPRPPFW